MSNEHRENGSNSGQRTDARRGYEPLLTELLQLYPYLMRNPPAWRSGYDEVAYLAHGWYSAVIAEFRQFCRWIRLGTQRRPRRFEGR